MPSNVFELRYYRRGQTRGRPCVELIRQASPEPDLDFCKYMVEFRSPGGILKRVYHFLPSSNTQEAYTLKWSDE